MWFVGLVIGGLVGGFASSVFQLDSALWMFFAALGAVAGIVLREKLDVGRRRYASAESVGELQGRVAQLELDQARLRAMQGKPAVEPVAVSEFEPQSVETPAVQAEPSAPPAPRPGTATVTRPTAAPRVEERRREEPSWIWRKLFGGNILAKIGIVMLFLGVGSGLKLAINFGLFPPSVRLLLAAVGGVALIGLGLWRRNDAAHRIFALCVQGGGFGVLYLVTYFALAWYRFIDPLPAFVLFALLGLACIGLALLMHGELLAILGISGAFLAPILASTGKGSHVMLFSLYLLLNVLVVGVNWVKGWRTLVASAFAFTLVIGMLWATRSFVPEFFGSTEAFLIIFSVLFSANSVLRALVCAAKLDHIADAIVLIGTPIGAAVSQTWLIQKTGFTDVALAWSSFAAGLYYAALAALLRLRAADINLQRVHLAIAISFVTAAVPLAFGAEVTVAFWAIEGAALVWIGIENRSRVALAFGYPIQLLAGGYFVLHVHAIAAPMPILNGFYISVLVVAACGAATAWITYRGRASDFLAADALSRIAAIAMAWAVAWWMIGSFAEINEFAPARHAPAWQMAVVLSAAWMLELAGCKLDVTLPRALALSAAGVALLWGPAQSWPAGRWLPVSHPMHDSMVFTTPLAFASLYALMARLEKGPAKEVTVPAHFYGLWIFALTLTLEADWVARELATFRDLWRLLAWGAPAALVSLAALLAVEKSLWPASARPGLYVGFAIPWLLGADLLWTLAANFSHSGGGSSLPYMPVLSFFDAAQILVFYAVLQWLRAVRGAAGDELIALWRAALALASFVWLSAMAMRIAHHWGVVPFEARALLRSGMAQSLLSLLWTSLAIGIMISATRSALRGRWFVGFALLGVVGAKFLVVDVLNKGTVTWTVSLIGVGLLILAASYFSPAPPKEARLAQ